MRRLVLFVLLMAASTVLDRPAEALTARDIIELSRAGLGEDVLLALIEVDRGVYPIDSETLRALKEAGVSERVIVALVRSGRELPPPPPAQEVALPAESAAPASPVVVVEPTPPVVQQVMVPVPVYVPVAPVRTRRSHTRRANESTVQSTFMPFQFGLPAVQPETPKPKKPVYWGHGGKLRPDAWRPDNDPR